jgi:hypothetical protein
MGAKSLSRNFLVVTDEDVVAIVHGEGSAAVLPWPVHTCENPLTSPLGRDPSSWVCRARGVPTTLAIHKGGSQCRGEV